MSTADILKEINNLPVSERLLLIQKTIRRILLSTQQQQLTFAAEELAEEYNINKELTSFTDLDLEDFYEAR